MLSVGEYATEFVDRKVKALAWVVACVASRIVEHIDVDGEFVGRFVACRAPFGVAHLCRSEAKVGGAVDRRRDRRTGIGSSHFAASESVDAHYGDAVGGEVEVKAESESEGENTV